MSFKTTPYNPSNTECEQSVRVYPPYSVWLLISNQTLKNIKSRIFSYRFDYEIFGRESNSSQLLDSCCWQLVRTHCQKAPLVGRPDELMQRRYSGFGPINPISTPPLNFPHCQVATLSLDLLLFQSKKAYRKRLQNAHPAKSTATCNNSLPVLGTWI